VPRDTLTREQIIKAAVQVLDADGLEGLNMRRLGSQLGCAPTAVYWHVSGKDELVVLAADELWDEIERPDPDVVGWRAAATGMARDLYAMITRHLWVAQAMGTYFIYGPRKASHDDHAIGIYEKAGFAGMDADAALNTVAMYVTGSALRNAAEAALTRRLGPDPESQADQMRKILAEVVETTKEYPRLRARAEEYLDLDKADPERSFGWGLDAIFDGLEGRLPGGGALAAGQSGAQPS
jgi:AcrR family transcriptional regulator